MKTPIKGVTEKQLVKMMLTDKPSKMIWNVAIEEAANKCIILSKQDDWSPGYKRSARIISKSILKLKKK
jgi:hypothetical protein